MEELHITLAGTSLLYLIAHEHLLQLHVLQCPVAGTKNIARIAQYNFFVPKDSTVLHLTWDIIFGVLKIKSTLLIYAFIKILLLHLIGSGKAQSIRNSYGSLYQEEERQKGQDDGKLEQAGEEDRENNETRLLSFMVLK